VIRAVARDDFASRPAACLAREFHRMLVRVGAAQGEEHAATLESGQLQETLGQRSARRRPPARVHEAQFLRLFLNGAYQPRVLVTQIHAFGQTAHIQIGVTRLVPEARALTARDGRRVPFRLNTPAMQHTRVFRHQHLSALF